MAELQALISIDSLETQLQQIEARKQGLVPPPPQPGMEAGNQPEGQPPLQPEQPAQNPQGLNTISGPAPQEPGPTQQQSIPQGAI